MNVIFSTPSNFENVLLRGPRRIPFEIGLFAGEGSLISREIRLHRFDDLVGSLNARIPRGASVRLEAQVRVGRRWTRWYGLAFWEGGKGGRSLGDQADGHGRVDVDTLLLKKPSEAFRFRIVMEGRGSSAPTLLRVSFCVTPSKKSRTQERPFVPGPWVRELSVPPISQIVEQKKHASSIGGGLPVLCSPTSVAMLLRFWDKNATALAVAGKAKDRANGLFGNWPLNVQAAASWGLSGDVARFSSLSDLELEIAEGRPVVSSVTILKGDLSRDPLRATPGHLLVVAGFTPKGDVIVRDPFAPSAAKVRQVYPRKEFLKIWLERKAGLVYLIAPRFPRTASIGKTRVDLQVAPFSKSVQERRKETRHSQLLEGEIVRMIEARGDSVLVEALAHPQWNGKSWSGYRGWVAAGDLGAEVAAEPSGLERAQNDSSRLSARERRTILASARRLLGTPYLWGGLSRTGIDCSGLVYQSYAASGRKVARDAKDQCRQFIAENPSRLAPGDLVFLSKTGEKVYHVLIHAGGGSLIESRDPEGVLQTTFLERFGRRLRDLRPGDIVPNLPGKKPEKIFVAFGRYRPISR